MKRSIIIIISLLLMNSLLIFAQDISDPNDRIYNFLSLWYEAGYIDRLPTIRPYSPREITGFLKKVISKGDAMNRDIATEYLQSLEGGLLRLPGDVFSGSLKSTAKYEGILDGTNYAWKSTAHLHSNGFITGNLAYSGKLSFSLIEYPNGRVHPLWTNLFDESKTGGGALEMGENDLDIGQLWNGGLFLENEYFLLKAGLMRSSVGPFFENGPVITPDAPVAGHFSITFRKDWFAYTTVLLDLYAKYIVDGTTGVKEGIPFPQEKYLVVHNAVFHAAPWLELGIIQSNLVGGRSNPVHFLPFQYAFYTQQLYGDWDSSFIGLTARVSMPWKLNWDTIFYVDDWNSFSTSDKPTGGGLSFDSAQNKFALQTGLAWSPCFPVFKKLKLSYLMITPYTYTHFSQSALNFLTYTHDGRNIGSILEPNSDQINLNLFLMPASTVDINVWLKHTRHANASEGYEEDGVLSDGTVFDDGISSTGEVTFFAPQRFLTQSVIEQVFQAGVDTECYVTMAFISTRLSAGYTFQYTRNRDLIAGTEEMKHIFTFMLAVEL